MFATSAGSCVAIHWSSASFSEERVPSGASGVNSCMDGAERGGGLKLGSLVWKRKNAELWRMAETKIMAASDHELGSRSGQSKIREADGWRFLIALGFHPRESRDETTGGHRSLISHWRGISPARITV